MVANACNDACCHQFLYYCIMSTNNHKLCSLRRLYLILVVVVTIWFYVVWKIFSNHDTATHTAGSASNISKAVTKGNTQEENLRPSIAEGIIQSSLPDAQAGVTVASSHAKRVPQIVILLQQSPVQVTHQIRRLHGIDRTWAKWTQIGCDDKNDEWRIYAHNEGQELKASHYSYNYNCMRVTAALSLLDDIITDPGAVDPSSNNETSGVLFDHIEVLQLMPPTPTLTATDRVAQRITSNQGPPHKLKMKKNSNLKPTTLLTPFHKLVQSLAMIMTGRFELSTNSQKQQLPQQKQQLQLQKQQNLAAGCDWLVLANDHTFIIPQNLGSLLHGLDANQPVYTGNQLQLPYRGKILSFASGGSGAVLSHVVVKLMLLVWLTLSDDTDASVSMILGTATAAAAALAESELGHDDHHYRSYDTNQKYDAALQCVHTATHDSTKSIIISPAAACESSDTGVEGIGDLACVIDGASGDRPFLPMILLVRAWIRTDYSGVTRCTAPRLLMHLSPVFSVELTRHHEKTRQQQKQQQQQQQQQPTRNKYDHDSQFHITLLSSTMNLFNSIKGSEDSMMSDKGDHNNYTRKHRDYTRRAFAVVSSVSSAQLLRECTARDKWSHDNPGIILAYCLQQLFSIPFTDVSITSNASETDSLSDKRSEICPEGQQRTVVTHQPAELSSSSSSASASQAIIQYKSPVGAINLPAQASCFNVYGLVRMVAGDLDEWYIKAKLLAPVTSTSTTGSSSSSSTSSNSINHSYAIRSPLDVKGVLCAAPVSFHYVDSFEAALLFNYLNMKIWSTNTRRNDHSDRGMISSSISDSQHAAAAVTRAPSVKELKQQWPKSAKDIGHYSRAPRNSREWCMLHDYLFNRLTVSNALML